MLQPAELPPRLADELIGGWPVARLATLGRAGPRQVPLVFARSGALLGSLVDGKPEAGCERARVRSASRGRAR